MLLRVRLGLESSLPEEFRLLTGLLDLWESCSFPRLSRRGGDRDPLSLDDGDALRSFRGGDRETELESVGDAGRFFLGGDLSSSESSESEIESGVSDLAAYQYNLSRVKRHGRTSWVSIS